MTARILPPTDEALALCAARLRAGEPVAMPTETVYGLAAVATDEAAVARVFAVKERPTFDPLIVHLDARAGAPGAWLAGLAAAGVVDAAAVGPAARARLEVLAAACWPGPLTLVLPRGPAIPDLVTAGLSTVAVRVPRHPVAQALLGRVGAPLAAPSANRFGRISPTTAEAVRAELGDRIALILDGGPCEVGLESTVLALGDEGAPRLLRPGGVPVEALEALLAKAGGGPVLPPEARAPAEGGAIVAPGMLASHYAPRKPLRLLPGPWAEVPLPTLRALVGEGSSAPPATVGLLLLQGDAGEAAISLERTLGRPVIARSLSARGDRAEAARHLFAGLRALDESPAELLLAEPCLDARGLGHAIADRLRRAAAGHATPAAGDR